MGIKPIVVNMRRNAWLVFLAFIAGAIGARVVWVGDNTAFGAFLVASCVSLLAASTRARPSRMKRLFKRRLVVVAVGVFLFTFILFK